MLFNTQDAKEIAKKLNATLLAQKKHDLAQFWHNGKLIGWYGIRRGRNLPHDYIPEQLHITPNQCKKFKVCTLTLQELVEILKGRGLIPQ